MKKKLTTILSLIALILIFSGCRPKTTPNEWVVTTATCWNSITVTEAGEMYPRLYTPCDQILVLPSTELAAEFEVSTKFANRVAAKVSVTYNWRITDPIQFINNAKAVTSSKKGEDHKIDSEALETLENSIVDKYLKDIIREYTPSLQAGYPETSIEKEILNLALKMSNKRGIEFSGMSLNVKFSPQIEEALDILSALEFYKTKNEEALGRIVIERKAGAASITTINNNTTLTPEEK